MSHTDRLSEVAEADVSALKRAEKNYGSSWKKRGGVGAFMMLCRKWDRLETALRPEEEDETRARGSSSSARVAPWDILKAIEADQREEGIIDDVRDLRRYLMLVEAEILERRSLRVSEGGVPSGLANTEVMEKEHYPLNLTSTEMRIDGPRTIRAGSMAGSTVAELYGPGAKTTVHPYTMREEYTQEYSY